MLLEVSEGVCRLIIDLLHKKQFQSLSFDWIGFCFIGVEIFYKPSL